MIRYSQLRKSKIFLVKKFQTIAIYLFPTLYFRSKFSDLTLNDLYDTTCMTHNRFSNFYCAYPIMQVVHTEFIKVLRTDYSAFKSSSKMIQEQAAAAVIVELISQKNKSIKNRKKEECVKP